jgi:uncharacterized protein YodC (DUF2158 family)
MGLQPGDLVQLKSGGPTMTVECLLSGSFENVRCCWFVGTDVKRFTFASDALTKVNPAPAPPAPTTPATNPAA